MVDTGPDGCEEEARLKRAASGRQYDPADPQFDWSDGSPSRDVNSHRTHRRDQNDSVHPLEERMPRSCETYLLTRTVLVRASPSPSQPQPRPGCPCPLARTVCRSWARTG
jgi:hypothetical protein